MPKENVNKKLIVILFMLYLLRNILLISREIIGNIPRTLISSFGIILLIACLVLSISVKDSVSAYLKKRIFGELRINQVKITAKAPASLFNFSAGGVSIDDAKIKKIVNIPEINDVQRVIRLNCPTSLRAGMLGMYLKTDMLVSGVDRSFFRDTMRNWKDFRHKDYVPVVIPLFVMDIYNNFAASNGLPSLGPKALKLLSMDLIIGTSSFSRNMNKEFKYNTRIFGFTETITTAGIIVPSDFIKNFCKANSQDLRTTGKCYSCIMLIANVREISDIPAVAERIRAMGLDIESQEDIAKKTGKAVFLLNAVLLSVLGIILFLTVIAVFNSYLALVYNRSHIFSIQRMLGASKIRIVFIFVLESGIIGALYGLIGYFIGYYALIYLTDNIPEWAPLLQGLSFRLESHGYLPVAVAFSSLVSVFSAFIPAVFASKLDLFNVMKR